ncbi:hypothetical protein HDV06_000285 [Boothiomyces sp. JEL0866]|nr:hypothetical protein HDV06_000285 [Boothiomyces sp. JEL0866]
MKLFLLASLLSATYTGEDDPEIFSIFKGVMSLEGANDHFEPMRLSNNYEDEPVEPQVELPGSYLKGQYFAGKGSKSPSKLMSSSSCDSCKQGDINCFSSCASTIIRGKVMDITSSGATVSIICSYSGNVQSNLQSKYASSVGSNNMAKFIQVNDDTTDVMQHYANYQPEVRKRDLTNSATSISVTFDKCSLDVGSSNYFFLMQSGSTFTLAGGCNGIFEDNADNSNSIMKSHSDVSMDTLGICHPYSTLQEGLEFMFQSSGISTSPMWVLIMALSLV